MKPSVTIIFIMFIAFTSGGCAGLTQKKQTDTAYDRGLRCLEKGDLSSAITEWKQYTTEHPKDPGTKAITSYITLLVRETSRQSARQAIKNENNIAKKSLDDHSVAVVPFETIGSNHPFGKAIQTMVLSDLAGIPGLQLVERIKIQTLMDEIKLGATGMVDKKTAPRVGRLLGAGKIVTGTVFENNGDSGKYQITTSVAETGTGRHIGFQEAIGERKEWFLLQKEIVYEILKTLNISPIPDHIKKIHTKNWDAYRLFAQGLDFMDKGDFPAARQAFHHAINKDATFDLARDMLQKTPPSDLSVKEIIRHAQTGYTVEEESTWCD